MEHTSSPHIIIPLPHSPELTVESHGWPFLRPFEKRESSLGWVADLPDSGPARIVITWPEGDSISMGADAESLTQGDIAFAEGRLRRIFRADEDFSPFWRMCEGHSVLGAAARLRAGALIRSASVFEDVVKTLCTTNCHWRNTKRMVEKLCESFGRQAILRDGTAAGYTFPTVERLASASTDDLKSAGLGYRAEFVSEFARGILDGRIDAESWARTRDSEELRETLLHVAGLGPYSANHMLVLLGHYRFIPCDSEVCSCLGLPPKADRREIERLAHERYGAWGDYAFLAYKIERVLRRHNYVDCG